MTARYWTGTIETAIEAWEKSAQKALKETPLDSLTRAFEGIVVPPLTARANGRSPLYAKAPGWAVLQRVDDPDVGRANRQAKDDLANGADGLTLVFEGAANSGGFGLPSERDALVAVLDGIDLSKTIIRIDGHPRIRRSADWFADLVTERGQNPKGVTFGIDYGAILAASGRLGMTLKALRASVGPSLAGYFAVGMPGALLDADGRVVHNAGGTVAQELAAMLSAALDHLHMFEDARQPLENGVGLIGFSLSVDQQFLPSIAKMRALRLLWARVQEAAGIERPVSPRIHAETSLRMLHATDAETNILRNTIAVAAAAMGGASSISVVPHTHKLGLADPFARRVARNQQLIARDESFIGDVSDPAAGSGTLEMLTDAICEEAWAVFQALEAKGGVLRALRDGAFQPEIAASAEGLRSDWSERAIIGVNRFKPQAERPMTVLDAERRRPDFPAEITCAPLPHFHYEPEGASA